MKIFLGSNLMAVFSHFLTLIFFNWRKDGWAVGDGWTRRFSWKKNMYFKNISKTIQYFYPIVSHSLRRPFKIFREKHLSIDIWNERKVIWTFQSGGNVTAKVSTLFANWHTIDQSMPRITLVIRNLNNIWDLFVNQLY